MTLNIKHTVACLHVCLSLCLFLCLCLFVSRAKFPNEAFLTETHEDISNCHVEDVHVCGGLHVRLRHNHHQHQQVPQDSHLDFFWNLHFKKLKPGKLISLIISVLYVICTSSSQFNNIENSNYRKLIRIIFVLENK